ncbi:hypothetical protein H8F24_17820 [Synechococcus sp. CBW1002]|uniref:DNA primase family protein n=1 Tax=Synechococcus sp. CBW1002 TaxID=1353134 RepID=UPI0018CFEAE0|nr:DNA primase family protein [Synechococcus sp. CBW1002]QPN59775.1 hypothetical protein H8F24_17820 [Synechococcus sp. CBW1002]
MFRYDAAAGYWQREGDDIYETRAQGLLRRVCKMAANKGPTYPYGSIRHVRDTVASLKVLAGQGPLSSATPPPVVVFRNGTYNLATGTLEPHDPDHGATYGIAADYKAGAACPPELRRLLTTCYPEGAGSIVRALIRWLIDPSIPYGQAFHLLGHTGTGKGTLLAFLLGLLPTDLQSSLGVCRPYRPARRVQRTLRPQTGSIRCRRLLVLLTIAMVLIRL